MSGIDLAPCPEWKSLESATCCFCADTTNQKADTRRHALVHCLCRQPFWYRARGGKRQVLMTPKASPAAAALSESVAYVNRLAAAVGAGDAAAIAFVQAQLLPQYIQAVLRAAAAAAPPVQHIQNDLLRTAAGFHSWLQHNPMADGSWVRQGVLHLRVQGFQTPDKALQYLKLGPTDARACEMHHRGSSSSSGAAGGRGDNTAADAAPPAAAAGSGAAAAVNASTPAAAAAAADSKGAGGSEQQPTKERLSLLGDTFSFQQHRVQGGYRSSWEDVHGPVPEAQSPQQCLFRTQGWQVALLQLWLLALPHLESKLDLLLVAAAAHESALEMQAAEAAEAQAAGAGAAGDTEGGQQKRQKREQQQQHSEPEQQQQQATGDAHTFYSTEQLRAVAAALAAEQQQATPQLRAQISQLVSWRAQLLRIDDAWQQVQAQEQEHQHQQRLQQQQEPGQKPPKKQDAASFPELLQPLAGERRPTAAERQVPAGCEAQLPGVPSFFLEALIAAADSGSIRAWYAPLIDIRKLPLGDWFQTVAEAAAAAAAAAAGGAGSSMVPPPAAAGGGANGPVKSSSQPEAAGGSVDTSPGQASSQQGGTGAAGSNAGGTAAAAAEATASTISEAAPSAPAEAGARKASSKGGSRVAAAAAVLGSRPHSSQGRTRSSSRGAASDADRTPCNSSFGGSSGGGGAVSAVSGEAAAAGKCETAAQTASAAAAAAPNSSSRADSDEAGGLAVAAPRKRRSGAGAAAADTPAVAALADGPTAKAAKQAANSTAGATAAKRSSKKGAAYSSQPATPAVLTVDTAAGAAAAAAAAGDCGSAVSSSLLPPKLLAATLSKLPATFFTLTLADGASAFAAAAHPEMRATKPEWEEGVLQEVFLDPSTDAAALGPACAGSLLSCTDQGLAGRARRAMLGLSVPVGILSSAATSALLHPEDSGFASYNINLCGHDKVWYVVPPARHQAFLAALQQQMGLPQLSTAAAMCAVKALLPLLPPEAVGQLGMRRLVQRPGDIILTCPGITFHTTLSLGTNLAESVNFMPHLTPQQQAAAEAAARVLMAQLQAALTRPPAPTAAAAGGGGGGGVARASSSSGQQQQQQQQDSKQRLCADIAELLSPGSAAAAAVRDAAVGAAKAQLQREQAQHAANTPTAAAAAEDAAALQAAAAAAEAAADVALSHGLPVVWARYLAFVTQGSCSPDAELLQRIGSKWLHMLLPLIDSWQGVGMAGMDVVSAVASRLKSLGPTR